MLTSTVAGAIPRPQPPSTALKTGGTVDSLRELVQRRALPDSTRYRLLRTLSDRLFTQASPDARRVGEQAVAVATGRRDWPGASAALYQLLVNCEQASDYVAATAYCQQALELTKAHKLPDQWRFTQCLGLLAVDTKDAARGLRWLQAACRQQARAAWVKPRERGGLLLNLATAFSAVQRYDSVLHYAARALPFMQQAGDARGLGSVYQFKGEVYALLRPQSAARLDSAAANMRRALQLFQRHHFPSPAAASALALARTYRQSGRPAASQQAAELALRLAQQTPMPEYQAEALSALAWAQADQGQVTRSFALENQAQDLRDSLFSHDKARALAQLQVRYDVKLLTGQKRAAEFEQRSQRAQLHSLWLLLGGLTTTIGVGGGLYWRLRRQKALLAVANQANCRAVAEKEVLVQEIHHRVKNNLQLVSSLLAWQSSTLPEPALEQALASSQARIQSMALVHEFLYRADNLSQVRMSEYLGELLDSLHRSLTTPHQTIHLSTDLAPLVMGPKEATALGLVVNELVTNAYKHAFRGLTQGHLHVSLAGCPSCPTGFELAVTDDGAGLPGPEAPRPTSSLGLQLVRTLAKQLKATVSTTPSFPTGTQLKVIRT